MTDRVSVRLTDGWHKREAEGRRIAFSAWQCFQLDGSPAETALLAALGRALARRSGVVIYGDPRFIAALIAAAPDLARLALAIVHGQPTPSGLQLPEGLAHDALATLPAGAETVFHAELSAFRRQQLRARLAGRVEVLGPELAVEAAPELVPAYAWTPVQYNIYPIPIPDIAIEPGLDMLLVDCPARNLALMPNGLGYVHNALERARIEFQTFDLDIVAYHRFHVHRLFDVGGTVALANGRELPVDPWQAEHYDLWNEGAVAEYFMPYIDEAAAAIAAARPKVLGLSIQECNETLSRHLVRKVKAALPEIVILVGGFSCYNADVGFRAFPDAEYMCIGEADLTVGPLVAALARGERPRNVPGVLSRHDAPGRRFVPAPMPHDLDKLDFPRYAWFDLSLYRNFNGYQLTPIIASRGCRWSRCTFCAERFYWRIRSPENFVDELEWLADHGCTLYMFNESDLNGMPEKVLDICEEIIRRGIKVKLTGQLRIHKKSDRAYYRKLHEAGFVALRFGVDAFSENALRLQMKGYTTAMISQNLRDCWEAGIFTEVNWVIGVPGEIDADVEESIDLILKNRDYIGRLANINPLILINGSVYWIDPEAHGIRFRKPREELYAKYPRVIPAEHWYSTEPYIDGQVRKQRFERIVRALMAAGFPVGPWAQRIIDAVESDLDGAGGIKIRRPDEETPDAKAPRAAALLRTIGNHRLYRYGDSYLGVPLSLGEVDFAALEAGRDGVVAGRSEDEAAAAIELAADWANARGHYDPRKRQRHFGGEMRAGSFLGEERSGPALARPVVFTYKGQRFALPAEALEGAAGTRPPLTLATLWRRFKDLLPHEARARIGNAVAAQPERVRRNKIRLLLKPPVLRAVLGGAVRILARGPRRDAPTGPLLGEGPWRVLSVTTVGAVPELLRVIGSYNLVYFDGEFYGLPHGLAVDWSTGAVGRLPGVIVGGSARIVLDRINEILVPQRAATVAAAAQRGSGPAGEISHVPVELGRLNGHRILSYEGWVYGMPESMGEVDLVETDVLELPGVIRDVSRDVVEHVIRERTEAPLRRSVAVGE